MRYSGAFRTYHKTLDNAASIGRNRANIAEKTQVQKRLASEGDLVDQGPDHPRCA